MMKKIISYLQICILTMLVFLLPACTGGSEQILVLYYSDPQGMYLIPVSTTVKFEGVNINKIRKPEDLEPVLRELGNGKRDQGLRNCIPEGVTFQNIILDKEKKQIELTINSSKPRLGDTDELLMIGALVNTLTELNGFESVKINPGNLSTDLDYTDPYNKDVWINSWYDGSETELIENNSLAVVYWSSKDKKYLVPITVPIPKNDVKTLLQVLENGPQGNRKTYLENSVNPAVDIAIKAANQNHIDVEITSKDSNLGRSVYEDTKNTVLLTISELNIFDTIKVITPNNADGDIIDLRKVNPLKSINRIEFFTGRT